MAELRAIGLIRDVPDFPQAGILFKDITPVLQDPDAFDEVMDRMVEAARRVNPTSVVAIESRGFLFGAPMALRLGLPFALVRKLGKLPCSRVSEEYALEYGTNTVEMHRDALKPGDRAVIVDDLLATGGTALATAQLVERLDATVAGFTFLIGLTALSGRHALRGYDVSVLIDF
ncbi:MAG: adenine phosphoribosyltransferase [Armatimonadetes bacterium]|nr:adenine phosphoribosyltransferase [Armatimonadota bacterium]